jgi:hypothetical protein
MVHPLLSRPLPAFLAAALAGFGAGCSLYAPTITDCSITCTEGSACPRGTSCKGGFCRPDSASGDCACKLGDTRPCGGSRGQCRPGTEVCTAERVWSGVCTGEGRPSPEVCNNRDDDCDGLIDDVVSTRVPATWVARARGDEVYLAGALDAGVFISRVLPGQPPQVLWSLADAGFTPPMRFGVGLEAVAAWPGNDAVRYARVQLDGGARVLEEALVTPPLCDHSVSNRGTFLGIGEDDETNHRQVNMLDGGRERLRFCASLAGEFLENDGGVTVVYSYQSASAAVSGVYVQPDILRSNEEVAIVSSTLVQQWGDSSPVLGPTGRLHVAMEENLLQLFVLATAVPQAVTTSFRQRVLDGGLWQGAARGDRGPVMAHRGVARGHAGEGPSRLRAVSRTVSRPRTRPPR